MIVPEKARFDFLPIHVLLSNLKHSGKDCHVHIKLFQRLGPAAPAVKQLLEDVQPEARSLDRALALVSTPQRAIGEFILRPARACGVPLCLRAVRHHAARRGERVGGC